MLISSIYRGLSLALVGIATLLRAQSPGDLVITQSPAASGGTDYQITSNRSVALTGFTVKVVQHSGQGSSVATLIYDSVSNGPGQPALKQGESYTWHFLRTAAGEQSPDYIVDAAIYADGLAIGENSAIQSLWKRREWAAIGLQQVFQDLDASVPDIENPGEAMSILKRSEEQRLPPGTPREERASVSNAYETVIAGFEVVQQQRAKGEEELSAPRIAALRQWARERIAFIQSQVRPSQVTDPSPAAVQMSH